MMLTNNDNPLVPGQILGGIFYIAKESIDVFLSQSGAVNYLLPSSTSVCSGEASGQFHHPSPRTGHEHSIHRPQTVCAPLRQRASVVCSGLGAFRVDRARPERRAGGWAARAKVNTLVSWHLAEPAWLQLKGYSQDVASVKATAKTWFSKGTAKTWFSKVRQDVVSS